MWYFDPERVVGMNAEELHTELCEAYKSLNDLDRWIDWEEDVLECHLLELEREAIEHMLDELYHEIRKVS